MNTKYLRLPVVLLALFAAVALLSPAGWRAFAAAQGSESPFCAFVRKLVAAVPSDFAEFKGEEDTINGAVTDHTIFRGTLALDAYSDCDLFIRHKENEKVIPPTYYCVLGPYNTVADATGVYEKDMAELRACFPQWQFTETNGAGGSDPTEVLVFSARQPGFTMVFTLSDMGINSKPDEANSGKPRAVLSLRVTGTVPAAPPVPIKKK
jgi:hypothetical protein